MTIKVAVIGAGIMGADHARLLATEVPGVKVEVICDADEKRASSVADQYGVTHVSADPESVIADKMIDAVLIAAPDRFHASLTLACIAAGKPVLCEKPLSQDSRECLEIMAAEEKRGTHLLQVGFMRRFDPAYMEVKSILKSGALGKASMFHCLHRNVSAPSNFEGQMAITNSAPHEFDIARWVLDTDYAAITVYRPGGVAAVPGAAVFIVLETTTGQLVDIEVNNNAAYGYDVRGEVVGEKGTALLRSPIHAESNIDLKQVTSYAADWRPRFEEAYRRQNIAWVQSIASGKPVGANAWDGYWATLTAEAGVDALNSKKTVAIKPVNKPPFYA